MKSISFKFSFFKLIIKNIDTFVKFKTSISCCFSSGFTIVELLVVISVIGTLATITVVSYAGISNKAILASLQSDLSSASKQLKMYNIDHGSYPTGTDTLIETSTGSGVWCPSQPTIDSKYCVRLSSGNIVDYFFGTSASFVLRIKNGANTYIITDDTQPRPVALITEIGDISGTAQVGSILSSGALTPSGAAATYQWQRCDNSNGTSCSDISEAISINYTLATLDAGKYIIVKATGTGGYSGIQTSGPTGMVIAVVTLQPDAATGIDASVRSHSAEYNTNYGSENQLYSGEAGYKRRSFIKFDISNIPANAIISSATLSLYLNSWWPDGGTPSGPGSVNNVSQDWVENIITWNNQPSVGNLIATQGLTWSAANWVNWDVSSYVSGVLNSSITNYGLRVAVGTSNGWTNVACWLSSDHPDSSYRPKLVVVYTSP